jgi:hypothetical protein
MHRGRRFPNLNFHVSPLINQLKYKPLRRMMSVPAIDNDQLALVAEITLSVNAAIFGLCLDEDVVTITGHVKTFSIGTKVSKCVIPSFRTCARGPWEAVICTSNDVAQMREPISFRLINNAVSVAV